MHRLRALPLTCVFCLLLVLVLFAERRHVLSSSVSSRLSLDPVAAQVRAAPSLGTKDENAPVTNPSSRKAHEVSKPLAPATATREDNERQEGFVVKKPLPFKPDSAEGQLAVQALSINTSLGEWRAVGPSNFGGKVYSVAIDPTNVNYVYAAYEVGGLWGTADGGTSWHALYSRFADVAFTSVKTHPTIPGLVAAGLIAKGEGYFASFNKHVGVLLSANAGKTWKLIGPTIDKTATVWDIGFGDSTGQVLYAATQNGLYKTTNQGLAWTKVLAYTGNDFFGSRASFMVDPLNSNVLLLADNVVGVMRSTNAGATWTEVDSWVKPTTQQNPTLLAWSSGAKVYAYAFTNGSNLALSTYSSTDEGLTWTPTAISSDFNQGMYDMAIAVDPFDANHVIIHGSYLQISTDGLQTFASDLGYGAGPDCESVVFDPVHPGVVYDGNDEGVHKSTDGGLTWSRFDTGVLTNKSIGGSTYAVGSDGRIYSNPADYGGQQYVPGLGYRRSQGYEYDRFWVNPKDPNNLYTSSGGLSRANTATQASANIDPGGVNTGSNSADSLEFDPAYANTVYFAGKKGLYKSANRGTTWTTLGVTGSGGIYYVRVAPSNRNHLYATDSGNVYSSTNGGVSFTKGASITANAIAVSAANENTIYIAAGDGLYLSTDSGNTVTRLTAFPKVGVSLVIADRQFPNQLYAALTSPGVLVSLDGGSSWQQLGSQLPLVQPNWMTEVGSNLYLGTGAGIWEINLQSLGACSQVTLSPASLTLPSSAGTYPVEVYVPGNCNTTATSAASWATVKRYATNGPSIMYVMVTDNSAGNARNSTVKIAGQTVGVTQLGGPNLVKSGNVVALASGSNCVTVSGTALKLTPCAAAKTTQRFTLQAFTGDILFGSKSTSYFGGPAYCLVNAGSYVSVSGDKLQSGAKITESAGDCTSSGSANSAFFLEPQTNGTWNVVGFDSLLCFTEQAGGASQLACSATTGFTIQ